jgi:cyclohexa-1,5-dienecarbonyl-CoA hydratase
MIAELIEVLEDLSAQAELKVVVVTGSERVFSAGVAVEDHTPDRVEQMIQLFGQLYSRLHSLPVPTVAVVQGSALGGGAELALGCDLVLASTSARFGQPEIKLGVFPPIAAALFPRLIGTQQAARLLFTGEVISAEQAASIGLVTRVVDDHEMAEALETLLKPLQEMSATALHFTKRALIYGADLGATEALPRIEDLYLRELMSTADAEEGISAFLQKRPPVWQDR